MRANIQTGIRSAGMCAAVYGMTSLLAGCQQSSSQLPDGNHQKSEVSAEVVLVDPSVRSAAWQGWGTSLAWFAYVIGDAPDPVRNQIADLLFDEQKGLGFNIVRYNIGGGEHPGYNTMEPRARIPGYQPEPGRYDWTADAPQRWMLQAAKKRGADRFEAFSNSPPYWMTNSGSVTGSKNGRDNLKTTEYQAFADYLATVVKYFDDHWGIRFQTVEPFNEPVSNWWKFGGRQEGAYFSNASQSAFIPILAKTLKSKGVSAGISAPDTNSIDETLNSWNSYPLDVQQAVAQINTHGYNGSQRKELNLAAKKAGKNLWMSEYGDHDDSGFTMSSEIMADVKQMNPAAWVYWQAVDGSGWGMLEMNVNNPGNYDFIKTKKYYVMGNYSKFIRPGYQWIDIGLANSVAACDPVKHTLVIVTTNASDTDETYAYNLQKFSKAGPRVDVFRTSADEDLKQLDSVPVAKGSFTAIAKAKSVTTYILKDALE